MADWLRSVAKFIGDRRTLFALNAYPPYLAAGIRVEAVSDDVSEITVKMGLHPYNRNFFGTHFGGNLYSMCDPFFLFQVLMQLGDDYVVWDKAATIRFVKPGKGTVRATFVMPRERVAEIRSLAAGRQKVEPTFTAQVKDESGEVVAEVEKLLYVKLKPGRPTN